MPRLRRGFGEQTRQAEKRIETAMEPQINADER